LLQREEALAAREEEEAYVAAAFQRTSQHSLQLEQRERNLAEREVAAVAAVAALSATEAFHALPQVFILKDPCWEFLK